MKKSEIIVQEDLKIKRKLRLQKKFWANFTNDRHSTRMPFWFGKARGPQTMGEHQSKPPFSINLIIGEEVITEFYVLVSVSFCMFARIM